MPPSLFDLIEFRAFASVWYWLLLGLVWTRVIHAPLGVPIDLVRRADRQDRQAERDVDMLCHLNLRQRAEMAAELGLWGVAAWAFGLTVLLLLGFGYGVEPAQALAMLAAPLALVQWLSGRARARIAVQHLTGDDLRRALRALRARVQGLGLASVFLAALWGMYSLLAARAL